jgi:hypothetical protein
MDSQKALFVVENWPQDSPVNSSGEGVSVKHSKVNTLVVMNAI